MIYRFLYTAILFLLISNCFTVSAQKSKSDPKRAQLDRVLILGMTNDYDARDMYEKELSYKLREMGYNMFSSVNVDKEKKELYTKEEILELVDKKNVHGVITMRLIDITTKEKYGTSDQSISGMNNNHNYFFNYIDTYYNVYSWSYKPQQRVKVEANLFDASDKSLVFQVDYTSENAESPEERADELTKKFAKAMRKSGFLKKKDK
jgi:hypothetical protein